MNETHVRDDYFGSGNESSVATPEPGRAGFTIPIRIGQIESNGVQQQIQQLVPTDFNTFYPKVIISYATGRRSTGDVEGAGPGLYIAAEVIKALFKSEIPCFSGLMTPAGRDWKEYFLRLDHANARVLVTLLSKAFFQSIACLKEVHDAIEKGLVIIPVRVEESESGAIDIARDMASMWPDATIENYARFETSNNLAYSKKLEQTTRQSLKVKDTLRSANTLPERGSLLTDSNALKKLINRVRDILLKEHPPRGSLFAIKEFISRVLGILTEHPPLS